jgi:hypothetical protein
VLRGTRSIHDTLRSCFRHLIATFSGILLFLMWFTLPTTNAQCTMDFNNFVFDGHLRKLSDKLVGGTLLSNAVFMGIFKPCVSLDTIDICSLNVDTKKCHNGVRVTMNMRGVIIFNATSNWLFATSNIQGRGWVLECIFCIFK